jgi:DNA adenine methylase
VSRLPHPIPYQGSKRGLAPLIAPYVLRGVETWFEPFAGSAAMTLWAAHSKVARHYVVGDVLAPIVQLLEAIVERPERTAATYAEIWQKQASEDHAYFNRVRDRYNSDRDPVDLLYIICRCVKNAIRFNSKGYFTQSVDKRRLGMHPQKMADEIDGASWLLRGRTRFVVGDWVATAENAGPRDFVYMDPPYLGTTIGRDKRYAEGLQQGKLIAGLEGLLARRVPFVLSYDGMTGGKEYGPPLPDHLGLMRLFLHAGKSSQATLVGRSEETVESLYLSPGVGEPVKGVIRPKRADQASFTF